MYSKDGQLKSEKEKFKDGCSKKEQSNNTPCTRNIENKSCHAEKCDMQPKKPAKDMQSNGSAMLTQHKMSKKQIVPQEDDKNCQINRRPLKSKMCYDQKCHENTNMWPLKPQMDVHLKKPAKKLIGLCKDKTPVKLQYVKILTLKVKFQGILTRTVKKMKILICGQ